MSAKNQPHPAATLDYARFHSYGSHSVVALQHFAPIDYACAPHLLSFEFVANTPRAYHKPSYENPPMRARTFDVHQDYLQPQSHPKNVHMQ